MTHGERIAEVKGRIAFLTSNFDRLLSAYIANPPFRKYGQFEFHKRTIAIRRQCATAADAMNTDDFMKSLYETIQAWGIGQRRSRLAPYPEFVSALQRYRKHIERLEGLSIDRLDQKHSVRELVWEVVGFMPVVANKSKVVANTKALHHILPELVVPFDREYSSTFFCQQNIFQQHPDKCYREAFDWFSEIAQAVNLSQYVKDGWNTSISKVIDNALVGFFVHFKSKVRLSNANAAANQALQTDAAEPRR